jgi:hypothetical protein
MRSSLSVFICITLFSAFCGAQVPYRQTLPDIKYSVSGERKLSRLSNDDALFTILVFEDANVPKETLPVWYTDELIKPYFQNYNPDYGRTLFVVSSMKNKKSIEKRLGITSYPEYVLVGGDRRILTRSSRAEDIFEYVTTNLSEYAVTDWATYLIRAKQLFESGQVFAAQRIVSDCLRHSKWDESFSQEVHKAIPRIIATMKDDDMYMSFVAEIKHKYNLGILSEADVYPFKKEFSIIHIMGDKT